MTTNFLTIVKFCIDSASPAAPFYGNENSQLIRLDEMKEGGMEGELHLVALLMQSGFRERSVEVIAWWKLAQS